ncbi:MAG: hypothetical protein ACJAZK_000162 [Psychroserpens sp.]|jgi:hypothetical protein
MRLGESIIRLLKSNNSIKLDKSSRFIKKLLETMKRVENQNLISLR